MDQKSKAFRYVDVSKEVKTDINRFTSDSTVGLLGHDENNIHIDGLVASGTFVIINGKYGVLTANHVWRMFKNKASFISFSVMGKQHYISANIEYINSYSPSNDIDICFAVF